MPSQISILGSVEEVGVPSAWTLVQQRSEQVSVLGFSSETEPIDWYIVKGLSVNWFTL